MPLGWPILARDRLQSAVRRVRSWLVDESWAIGIIDRRIDELHAPLDPASIHWVAAPAGSYLADPFGLPGEPGLLCERLDHRDGLGRLVSLLPQAGGGWREQPLRLTLHGHASFPFAFRHGADLFCLPENAASRRLTLWRRGDDGGWQPHLHLAEGIRAVDPTLFAWAGRWWVAYTDGDLGQHDNLCLLHAPDLGGPWQPHRGNPVKIDIRSSRPAGTPFLRNGELHRPAQDCAAHYGAAVVINRVLELTPDSFAEEPVSRLAAGPDWPYPDGLHTLTAWGSRTLIDAKRHGFVPAAFRRRLAARLPRGLVRRPASGLAPDRITPC